MPNVSATLATLGPNGYVITAPGAGRSLLSKASIEVIGTADCNPGAISTATNVGTTWQQIYACRSRPLAIRVVYTNPTATAYTVDKTFVKSSSTFIADGDPTGADSWVAVTFAAAASIVVPAGSTTAPAQVVSDWIYIAPVSRTDAGTYPLLHVRSYVANGGATAFPYNTPFNYATYAGNKVAGLVRGQAFQAGDQSSSNGFTGSSGVGIGLYQSVQLKESIRGVRIASLGDSIEFNNTPAALPTNGGNLVSWVDTALAQVNPSGASNGVVYSHVNCGVGGQTVAQYLARLTQILANESPDIVLLSAWSPNGSPGTQAAQDAQLGLFYNAINQILAAGALPIVRTSPPFNAGTAGSEAFRVATNTLLRASTGAFLVNDVDALVAGNSLAGVVQWNPLYSGEGIHPNDAGEQLWAVNFAAVLRQITVL